jgi:hypothetical protein
VHPHHDELVDGWTVVALGAQLVEHGVAHVVHGQPVLLVGSRPLVTARHELLWESRIRREGEEAGPVTVAELALEVERAGIPDQFEAGRPAVRRELRPSEPAQFAGAHAERRHAVSPSAVFVMLEGELDAIP